MNLTKVITTRNTSAVKTAPVKASNDEIKATSTAGFVNGLTRWIQISGITRSLHQLDDRTLEDIGISRYEIRQYAERLVNNDNSKTAA